MDDTVPTVASETQSLTRVKLKLCRAIATSLVFWTRNVELGACHRHAESWWQCVYRDGRRIAHLGEGD